MLHTSRATRSWKLKCSTVAAMLYLACHVLRKSAGSLSSAFHTWQNAEADAPFTPASASHALCSKTKLASSIRCSLLVRVVLKSIMWNCAKDSLGCACAQELEVTHVTASDRKGKG